MVEKYEALLEVQRHSMTVRNRNQQINLQEEFSTSGEFSSLNTKYTNDDGSGINMNMNMTKNNVNNQRIQDDVKNNQSTGVRKKTKLRTPTDFSEAESASSGFSDETSNKATQTDEKSGFFLCTIADGDDCKFSIYDNASPIDSRFRDRPEYRVLFKEIFQVLKKAAENKEEGEKLPLLDDTIVKAPPVTPATEELPEICDDNQSVISSAVSEQSVAMSERITKTERKRIEEKKHIDKNGQENKPPIGQQILEDGRILTPYRRQPLEYLAVTGNLKKKSKKNRRIQNIDRSDSPILPSPPRVYYTSSGKKRRDMRPFNLLATPNASTSNTNPMALSKMEWNGNSMTIYNRNVPSPTPNVRKDSEGFEYKPSAASQDLHKLKKLDLSYAEVLRRADQCREQHQHNHPHHHHHHHEPSKNFYVQNNKHHQNHHQRKK